jgi:hypothetical protein
MDQLNYTILYTGSDSKTHFKDAYMPWHPMPGAVMGSPLVTSFREATNIGFLHIPVGLRSRWHPAPRKQFALVLTGIMEVEAGDGQKRTFTPGSVLLVTDVDGDGHRTNVLGGQDVLVAWVPVP